MAEWGALLRRCLGLPDRGFKSLPLRQAFSVVVVAIVIVAMTSVSATPASAAGCTQHHAAKPNDSWTRLAARFGIPLSDLLTLNGARESTPLFVGDRVCVSTRPSLATPSQSYTRKQVRSIIREVWPDELEETALYVAQRESNFVHAVVGGKNNCCLGLFQIYWSVHRTWLSTIGITDPSQLLDPRTNAEAALALFRRNGNSWRPWWTGSWRP